jgi:glycosyltransferase involved in cell wall biosynthesis
MTPLLSIITITRNDAAGLAQTLHSLREQTVDHSLIEHVIVDGASVDDTLQVIDDLALPNARIVSEPDRGVYDAMNKGIELSSGSYVHFLNSGDVLHGRAVLDQLVGHLQSQPTWVVARARHMHGGQVQPSLIANFPHNWSRHALGLQPHCHQACVFSRKLLDVLGHHSEMFGFAGDFDLILRAGLAAPPSHFDTVLVDYAGGGISAIKSDEIPMLLAEIRAQRFELSTSAQRLNRVFARWRVLRHRIHQQRQRLTR